MKKFLQTCTLVVLSGVFLSENIAQTDSAPKTYVSYQSPTKPIIDGKLDDAVWELAPWSDAFVDIQGDEMPKPTHLTRMKMLWDKDFFYIGVKLDEPHLWATYTERESVIFHENDIEVFLDPDGDTHNYYEWEINALGTLWDLLLTKPYKDGGKPINGWNINDFEFTVHLEGTLNDPSDTDVYWSVEMAIPWSSLTQRSSPPSDGHQWRINFSRVQWQLEVKDNMYTKVINPETGKHFPEDNWVWSPIGVINMHIPDRWGYVQFSEVEVGTGTVPFVKHADEQIKTNLRDLYYAQKAFFKEHSRYAETVQELNSVEGTVPTGIEVEFEVSRTRFKLSIPSIDDSSKNWFITEDGRIWKQ
ncbi:carbohydrate-binding family 9-like protein [Lunatibacter salilacus]|uniref:carbohydrate-binding family 9-like protein n=1 Tax=Lunatibacter salilacus TaxID=2483804 RepID=UPI00131E0E04|nr:carbohydrate-binding family 9-like protein [Lunatibacter salilacus]